MNTKLRLLIVMLLVTVAAPFVAWHAGSAAQDTSASTPQGPKNDHGPKFRKSKKPVSEHYAAHFPLPGSRPYSLIGMLDGQNFYIGASNQISHDFSSPRRLFLRTNDDIPGNGSGAFNCKVEVWKDLPDARADFMWQNVPATMMPGETVPVSISMKNVGTTTWSAGTSYKLGTHNDSTTWGANRDAAG